MIKMTDFDEVKIAYFSMEIGINSNIPTYSGGLGVLAGDTLRSCADLKIPMIGVTLLYTKGYFNQIIDKQGNQSEEEVHWDVSEYMELLPEQVSVQIEGREVHVRAWLYRLQGVTGQINPVIFLDTDFEANAEEDRNITHQLYGQDQQYRLRQEAVLGVGGIRLIEALGCNQILKYHMNEGHSALLTLELARRFGESAIDKVRDKCVFTTHTPVPAGHDQFPREMAETLLGDLIPESMKEHIFYEDKLNMTYLGLRLSEYVNGVAKKHGEVSRDMFPGYHIDSITNGVHSFYWTCPEFKELYDKYLPGWSNDPYALRYALGIKRRRIWETHLEAKRSLVNYLNTNYRAGMSEKIFTIGFARRAATYKRADMLFSDIDRLMKIAKRSKGGIQIVYAGKAHPKDQAGKDVIKKIIEKMKAVGEVINCHYIENYNMEVAKILVAGVDIWLNTPERPFEASGTSGMKAALNGVPHFSVLDGWWLEGHIENVTGWAIGGFAGSESELDTAREVEDLYGKLEYLILPTFYQHREVWMDIMAHTIATNGAFFNTHRMVEQYVLHAYFKDHTV